jgi:hypothetical protein
MDKHSCFAKIGLLLCKEKLYLGIYMRSQAVALLLIAMLGGSIAVVAAFMGKTNLDTMGNNSVGSRGAYPQNAPGYQQVYWGINDSPDIQNPWDISNYIYLLLNYINRNVSLYLESFNVSNFNLSISRTTVEGTLTTIRGGIMYIEGDSATYKVIIPWSLFDEEKLLYLDEVLLLRYINVGDRLFIDALNITLSPLSGKGDINIYIAIRIQDITTGRSLAIVRS